MTDLILGDHIIDHETSLFDPPVHDHELDNVYQFLARAASEWGSGYPRCQWHNQVTIVGGGIRVTCRVEISQLVKMLLDESVKRGYKIRQTDTGAMVCRPIGSTTIPSEHSWGLAIDINWQTNGFGYNVPHDIPQWMINLWKQYGFNYGGDWSGKKDWMHFEWRKSRMDAARYTEMFIRDHQTNPDPPKLDIIPPAYNPPYGPIVDNVRDTNGAVLLEVSPYGDVFAWGTQFHGPDAQFKLEHLLGHKITGITPATNGYVLTDEHQHHYSFPVGMS